MRKEQGLVGPLLSPADLYDRINGGRDQGSMLEDAMAELAKNGVGTVATSSGFRGTGRSGLRPG